MDNASKALLIVGSILITLMIVALAVFLFRNGQDFTTTVSSTTDDTVIAAFNAKFLVYETVDSYDVATNRFTASTELNTIDAVISAVNFAVSVNDENNNSYKYVDSYGLETTNAVEVIIDISAADSSDVSELSYSYYSIEPNSGVKEGYLYGQASLAKERASRINSFTTANGVKSDKFLEIFSTSKLVSNNNKSYTIYKYYFLCTLEYDNNVTSKVNSVQFTLVKDEGFESL